MRATDLNDYEMNSYFKITDFENFFDVHEDENGKLFYNLNETMFFDSKKPNLDDPETTQMDIARTGLSIYTCTHREFWTTISYKLYGTTRLAWTLMKINDVDAAHVFDPKQPGDRIWYIPKEAMESIVAQLNEFDN